MRRILELWARQRLSHSGAAPDGKILPMPSKPILAVALALGVGSVPATAQQADPLPALKTRVERLQAHIESIESVRAIKRLQ